MTSSTCARCRELEAQVELLKKRLKQRRPHGPAARKRNAARTAARKVQRNRRLVDNATNYRKVWTGPELELASRTDLTIGEIAAVLHRSYDAVRHMKRKLNGYPDARTRQLRDGPVPPTATS